MIMVTSIGAIAAADDYESVGDYTFDIPDGYQVVDKDDVSVGMELDENHTVLVYQLDGASDINFFKFFKNLRHGYCMGLISFLKKNFHKI